MQQLFFKDLRYHSTFECLVEHRDYPIRVAVLSDSPTSTPFRNREFQRYFPGEEDSCIPDPRLKRRLTRLLGDGRGVEEVEVMYVSKTELLEDFDSQTSDSLTTLWKKLLEWETTFKESRDRAPQPFGLLIGNYEFTAEPKDLHLLDHLSRIAALAHAPFLSTVAIEQAAALISESKHPLNRAWKSLRDSPFARYLYLCVPEARPTDAQGTEDGEVNPAFLLAERILIANRINHWCWHFMQNGAEHFDSKYQTHGSKESDRRELSQSGLVPFVQTSDGKMGFVGARSVYRNPSPTHGDSDPPEEGLAHLEYLLPLCRFLQLLQVIHWEYPELSAEELQESFRASINDMITERKLVSERIVWRFPLRDGTIVIKREKDSPHLDATGFLRFHCHRNPDYRLPFRVHLRD